MDNKIKNLSRIVDSKVGKLEKPVDVFDLNKFPYSKLIS